MYNKRAVGLCGSRFSSTLCQLKSEMSCVRLLIFQPFFALIRKVLSFALALAPARSPPALSLRLNVYDQHNVIRGRHAVRQESSLVRDWCVPLLLRRAFRACSCNCGPSPEATRSPPHHVLQWRRRGCVWLLVQVRLDAAHAAKELKTGCQCGQAGLSGSGCEARRLPLPQCPRRRLPFAPPHARWSLPAASEWQFCTGKMLFLGMPLELL